MKDNRGRLANKRVDLYTFLNANLLHGSSFFWNVKLLLDKVIVVFFPFRMELSQKLFFSSSKLVGLSFRQLRFSRSGFVKLSHPSALVENFY